MKKEKGNSSFPQFITNNKGEKVSVILPIKQYLKILEKIEENEDVKLYDEVKARNEKRISLDDYIKSRKKVMPLYRIEISQTAAKQLDKLPEIYLPI